MKELLDFIRFRISLSGSFLAVSGYLLFNRPDIYLIFVALGSFFLFAFVYSYNNITDREEDLKNRKKVNRYVYKNGLKITIASGLIGISCSIFLSPYSIILSLIFLITGFSYSHFRIKKYCLIKNLYTAFLITQIFIFGAVNVLISNTLVFYSLFFYVIIFTGSVLSDMRDHEGDKIAGVNTLPVLFDRKKIKAVVCFLLVSVSVFIVMFNISRLFVFLPFSFLSVVFSLKENYHFAHLSGSMGFVFLPFWLLII